MGNVLCKVSKQKYMCVLGLGAQGSMPHLIEEGMSLLDLEGGKQAGWQEQCNPDHRNSTFRKPGLGKGSGENPYSQHPQG